MRLRNASASTSFSATWSRRSSLSHAAYPSQLAVGHTASVALATTMPFYQLVCIAAHYPEYVCLGPLHNFGTTC